MSGAAVTAYGSLGRIGVGTPQANPTVEAELAILLPRACTLHVTRLTSRASTPEQRLRDYLERLDASLESYDTLRPDVFGFACTGSSYLLGAGAERRLVDEATARCGFRVETAARAILWGLQRLGATRIAMIAPYPQPLVDAACRYWSAAGLEVCEVLRVATRGEDTRSIYDLGGERAVAALGELRRDGVEAVLVSGTGMPGLAALRDAPAGLPVISSNSCLAARLLALLGREAWLEPGVPAIRGWRQRYDEACQLSPPGQTHPRGDPAGS